MPTGSGPCRFGQYAPFIEGVVEKQRIPDVALFSLSGENSYSDFHGSSFTKKAWTGVVLADIMQDIYSALLACAAQRPRAMEVFWQEWSRQLGVLERGCEPPVLQEALQRSVEELARIPLRRSLAETPVILLTGEIFVRHDELSRQYIVERFAEEGFAVKVSSGMEWIYYTDWCYANGMTADDITFRQWLQLAAASDGDETPGAPPEGYHEGARAFFTTASRTWAASSTGCATSSARGSWAKRSSRWGPHSRRSSRSTAG